MTPYLKGNVAGPCPDCEGAGFIWVKPKSAPPLKRKCRTCKGRGIVGRSKEQVIAEMINLSATRIDPYAS